LGLSSNGRKSASQAESPGSTPGSPTTVSDAGGRSGDLGCLISTTRWARFPYPLPNMHTPVSRARQWQKMKARRAAWLKTNGPCKCCGSWKRLEVDHVDPAQKVTHTVWSWSEAGRAEELAKCQVLCHDCHVKKTTVDRGGPWKHGGTRAGYDMGCRCTPCRAAKTAAMNEWRWRTGRRKPR
jgi:hypothetical protein